SFLVSRPVPPSSSSLSPIQLSSLLQLLLLMMIVLQLLQPAVAKEEEVYRPDEDEHQRSFDTANISQNRFVIFTSHANGQIRDRWCQERCMRHCYCTYGHSCRRSCIAHCDRGPYTGGLIDPFMHSRSKRAATPESAAPAAAQQQGQPEETDNDKLPSWQKLAKDTLPYLDGFEYDSRAILRRKTGRPVWNPLTKDPGAKQERLYDTRWGPLCQDNGN
ncbi:hypothetical protein PENTCL1PPCAC_24013, partial [Pristionchus entomophagus]